jgi:glycosyltransferase involved in cell wall biosynthesis
MHDPPTSMAIVTPVFNDWSCLERLIAEIDQLADLCVEALHIVVVDDGSQKGAKPDNFQRNYQRISSVRIVSLACNLGHQRAIAVGLVIAANELPNIDAVVVMDCDGEDRPSDVLRLLDSAKAAQVEMVVACRGTRQDSRKFRFFYSIYKLLFRILTGRKIDFGNFCLMSSGALQSLVRNPHTWNHLASAISRSGISYLPVVTDRGARYYGESRMNFVHLVEHGLSAIAVFTDIVLVRVIVATLSLSCVTLLGLVGVMGVRFLTDAAIPGWASDVAGSLLILFLLALVFSSLSVFQLLNLRCMRMFVPMVDCWGFLTSTSSQTLFDKGKRKIGSQA